MTMKDDGPRYRPTFLAHAYDKRGKCVFTTSPYDTREEAVRAAFTNAPRAERVACGYGYNGGFDIRFITRRQWEEASGHANT